MRPGSCLRNIGCTQHFSTVGWGIFIAILSMNREISRGLRSPGLETTLVSRPGLFSLKNFRVQKSGDGYRCWS